MKKLLITVLIIAILVIVVIFYYSIQKNDLENQIEKETGNEEEISESEEEVVTEEYPVTFERGLELILEGKVESIYINPGEIIFNMKDGSELVFEEEGYADRRIVDTKKECGELCADLSIGIY